MSKTNLSLSIVVGLAFILATLACDGQITQETEADRKELSAKQEAQALEALSRFGSHFNAKVVNDLDLTVAMGVYSILLEKTLVREGSKPIVLRLRVEDISKIVKGYLVQFSWLGNIFYSLKCQKDHVDLILENTSDRRWTIFAVVAVIDSVKRIDLSLWAERSLVEEGGPPSIGFTSGETFWATGRCLAVKPINELLPD